MVFATGGIFPYIHADPGDELSGMGKTLDVTDLGDHR
jgi:hypothetical protein